MVGGMGRGVEGEEGDAWGGEGSDREGKIEEESKFGGDRGRTHHPPLGNVVVAEDLRHPPLGPPGVVTHVDRAVGVGGDECLGFHPVREVAGNGKPVPDGGG